MQSRALAVIAALGLVLAACSRGADQGEVRPLLAGAESAAPAATGPPIVLGSVSSVTGSDAFPESTAAALAVFEQVNRSGGVNGRPIEYVVLDDRNTLSGAATAARKLVEEDGVLAMVAGASYVDCATNAPYYATHGIVSVAGVGACDDGAANVVSLATGPFLDTFVLLDYLSSDLGRQHLCFSGQRSPATLRFRDVYLPAWQQATGVAITSVIATEVGADLTDAVLRARADGCDAVVLAYTGSGYAAYAQAAQAAGVLDGTVVYAMLSSGYSESVLELLGGAGDGWYAASDFEPFSGNERREGDMRDFVDTTKRAGLPSSGTAQAGYLAALLTVEGLRSVEGDYTRESVAAAMRNARHDSALMTRPATWVPSAGGDQLNTGVKVVQIRNGEFATVSDWLGWPRTN